MSWAYSYNPHIWPPLIAFTLTSFLCAYSWRRRTLPGVRLFAMACLFASLWAVGSVLEIASNALSVKIFWIKFQAVAQLLAAGAMPAFIVKYAGLGRWLNRRNLLLLSVPMALGLALVITNYHGLVWTAFTAGDYVVRTPGRLNLTVVGFANLLGLASVSILIWLAARSPQHRWPASIMVLGQLAGRGTYLLQSYTTFLEPGEAVLLMFGFWFSAYAVAIFRFHVMDPVPVARSAVIEQMGDGMMVLDLQGNIVDFNPAAGKIFGLTPGVLRGSTVAAVLPAYPALLTQPDARGVIQAEVMLGDAASSRYFNLDLTLLKDKRGEALGRLLVLREVTAQKQAQAQILAQQQVLATLKERERLARELHDSIGQVLGYVSIQAQTARKWAQEGHSEKAASLLERLAEVARDAHADVRESILNLKSSPAQEWSFVPALKQYLDHFQANYGVLIALSLSDETADNSFDPVAGVQVLRAVQEALTNARKHGGARTVRVSLDRGNGRARISIVDDGCGFDNGRLPQGGHFGLSFMRERMEQIGGSANVESQVGAGTVVTLEAPFRN